MNNLPELVIRYGEYELTLRPEISNIILCEKGGRVCLEHVEDEHIFGVLYAILAEYVKDDDEEVLEAIGPVKSDEEVQG